MAPQILAFSSFQVELPVSKVYNLISFEKCLDKELIQSCLPGNGFSREETSSWNTSGPPSAPGEGGRRPSVMRTGKVQVQRKHWGREGPSRWAQETRGGQNRPQAGGCHTGRSCLVTPVPGALPFTPSRLPPSCRDLGSDRLGATAHGWRGPSPSPCRVCAEPPCAPPTGLADVGRYSGPRGPEGTGDCLFGLKWRSGEPSL